MSLNGVFQCASIVQRYSDTIYIEIVERILLERNNIQKLILILSLCRESRVGDACFFIEKVLDRIYELDEACAQSFETCRKQLWPHYHEMEAKRDEEQEKKEKEEKKKKAKVSRVLTQSVSC